jgi:hypothetical protein
MMENWFWLYLITRIDAVGHLFGVIAVLTMIAVAAATVCYIIVSVENRSGEWPPCIKRGIIRGIVFIALPAAILATLLPTKNDLFFILGGAALIEVAQTDEANRLASKSVQAVEQWLDKQITERGDDD